MTEETKNVTRQRAVPEDSRGSGIRYRRLFEAARDGI